MTGIKLDFPYRVRPGDYLADGSTLLQWFADGRGTLTTADSLTDRVPEWWDADGRYYCDQPPQRLIDGNARGKLQGHGLDSFSREPEEDIYQAVDPMRRISGPPKLTFHCKCGHETPSYEQHIADVLLGVTT